MQKIPIISKNGSNENCAKLNFLQKTYWRKISIQSLLEYKAMNVKRQRGIFVELWSNSIQIALRRNYGFLHSFHDFSKSNAFSKNLIRTKFILHKISFQMSILSNSRTSWMFYSKVTVLFNINFDPSSHQTRLIQWEGEQILGFPFLKRLHGYYSVANHVDLSAHVQIFENAVSILKIFFYFCLSKNRN